MLAVSVNDVVGDCDTSMDTVTELLISRAWRMSETDNRARTGLLRTRRPPPLLT